MSENSKKRLSKPAKLLIIATVCLLVCSFFTAAFNSSWFSVRVLRMNVIGDDGANTSALMYVPKSASNENKAPVVILVHGNSTSAIQQSSHAIELSRRGYIAISIDIAGRGQSELGSGIKDLELYPSLQTWIDYVQTNPIVDQDQIILSSHSMGGMICTNGIEKNPGVIDTYICNGTRAYAKAVANGVNSCTFGGEGELNTYEAFVKSFSDQTGVSAEDFEPDKIYEVDGLKFAAAVHHRTHAATFWCSSAIKSICNYIQAVNPTGTYIDGSNQIWIWRDIFGILGMASVIAFMLALVYALINTSFFSIVKQPLPRVIGLPKAGFALSVVVAVCAVFFGFAPFAKLYNQLLPSTSKMFPTILANGMITFVMCLALISIVMGTLFLLTDGKKKNAKIYDLGLTTAGNTRLSGELILKSLLIAIIVVFCAFTWFKIMEDFAGATFQCACMGLSTITPLRLRIALPYMVFYFINFFVSGFAHNVERRLPSTGNKKKDDIIAMIVNIVIGTIGMALYVIVIVAYDYATPGSNNAPVFLRAGLHSLFSYGLIWFMASTSAVTTACFRMTGTIWTGAFVNAIYCALTLLSTVPMTAVVR